jgi:YidC/Oxa1 family membrane protein insertase
MLSMKRMQEKTKRIQPKIAALKEKYRKKGKKDIDSRGQLNQETMALYQKEGINPMGNLGGCLPLLLQMPILYGFYNLLQVAIELRQAPWIMWVTDLSQADPVYILPIVMGGSMVFQQVLTGAAIADPAQRKMMYMTPVLFTLFFLNLPAGLVLYWLVNNLLGIVQQWFINRRYELERVAAATSARRKPAASKS